MKYLILIWALIGLSACATKGLKDESMTPVTDTVFGIHQEFYKACLSEGSNISQCDATFYQAFSSKLIQEYPGADINEVILECKLEPKTCGTIDADKARVLEGKIARSHNYAMKSESSGNFRKGLGAMLKGAGNGMSQNSKNDVNCVSNKYGNTYYTNCK